MHIHLTGSKRVGIHYTRMSTSELLLVLLLLLSNPGLIFYVYFQQGESILKLVVWLSYLGSYYLKKTALHQ